MPKFDGTGPQGRGPMTGRGMGFCVLKKKKDKPGELEGFAGLQGKPIRQKLENSENLPKGDINILFSNRTSPVRLGPLTANPFAFCAGYPAAGYMNPAVGRVGFYGPAGYGVPYARWANPWFRRGFGFAWGCVLGRGRRVWL